MPLHGTNGPYIVLEASNIRGFTRVSMYTKNHKCVGSWNVAPSSDDPQYQALLYLIGYLKT